MRWLLLLLFPIAACADSVLPVSGGLPGGTTGQVQYNNGGAFGGLSVTGTGLVVSNTNAAMTSLTLTGGTFVGSIVVSGSFVGGVNFKTGGAALQIYNATGNDTWIQGTGILQLDATTLSLSTGGGVKWSVTSARLTGQTSSTLDWNNDTVLQRDGAANTLALRNSTAAQRFNIGNTFTSTSVREDLSLYNSSNVGHIGMTQTGATARALQLDYGGTTTAAISIPITSGAVNVTSLSIGSGSAMLKVLTATATLDFPSTIAQTQSDLTITVTGAALGDCVLLGVPNGSVAAKNETYWAWVSASDTVTVRFCNAGLTSDDPVSGSFRATVIQF